MILTIISLIHFTAATEVEVADIILVVEDITIIVAEETMVVVAGDSFRAVVEEGLREWAAILPLDGVEEVTEEIMVII